MNYAIVKRDGIAVIVYWDGLVRKYYARVAGQVVRAARAGLAVEAALRAWKKHGCPDPISPPKDWKQIDYSEIDSAGGTS